MAIMVKESVLPRRCMVASAAHGGTGVTKGSSWENLIRLPVRKILRKIGLLSVAVPRHASTEKDDPPDRVKHDRPIAAHSNQADGPAFIMWWKDPNRWRG